MQDTAAARLDPGCPDPHRNSGDGVPEIELSIAGTRLGDRQEAAMSPTASIFVIKSPSDHAATEGEGWKYLNVPQRQRGWGRAVSTHAPDVQEWGPPCLPHYDASRQQQRIFFS